MRYHHEKIKNNGTVDLDKFDCKHGAHLFNNLDQDVINKSIDDWMRRLDVVIDAQGGYFE